MIKPGKYVVPKPKMWVQPNSPYAGPLVDVVVYPCPLRKRYSVAVLDKHNNWWTAPNWTHGGAFWTERLDSMPIEHILHAGLDIPGMLAEMDTLLTRVNGGVPGESAMLFGDGVDHIGYAVPYITLQLAEDEDDYKSARRTWDNEFGRVVLRPTGATNSAHHLSVRAARYFHVRRCKVLVARMARREAKEAARQSMIEERNEYYQGEELERTARLAAYTAQDILG